jgi:hypothetical protein
MAKYFNFFPKILYTSDTISGDVVNNLTSRFSFEKGFKNNTSVCYEYDIQDSDTPEIIAAKFYGDSERHWVVLMFNDITDPQFDWPMDYRTLISFIDEKYKSEANVGQSGSSWAQSHVHSYYKVETRTTLSTNTIVVNKFEVDSNTYSTIATTSSDVLLASNKTIRIQISKQTQSHYDYEMELNESKRKIKLLKPEFVNNIESEFRRVIA